MVVHGGSLSVDREPMNQQGGWDEADDDFRSKLRRVEAIVRYTIQATIFGANAIDERTEGREAIKLLLKNLDGGSNGTSIRQNIPQWLLDEVAELYSK